MAYDKTENEQGTQVEVLVANESEDGTGVWHAIAVDSNGYLLIVAVA